MKRSLVNLAVLALCGGPTRQRRYMSVSAYLGAGGTLPTVDRARSRHAKWTSTPPALAR